MELRCGSERVEIGYRKFLDLCSIWQNSPDILKKGYDVKTEVTPDGWEVFIKFLNGEDVCLDISEGIYPTLVKLAEEFRCPKLEELLKQWRTKVKEGLVLRSDLLEISSEMSASKDAIGTFERRIGRMEEDVMNALEEMLGWKEAVEDLVRRMERMEGQN